MTHAEAIAILDAVPAGGPVTLEALHAIAMVTPQEFEAFLTRAGSPAFNGSPWFAVADALPPVGVRVLVGDSTAGAIADGLAWDGANFVDAATGAPQTLLARPDYWAPLPWLARHRPA